MGSPNVRQQPHGKPAKREIVKRINVKTLESNFIRKVTTGRSPITLHKTKDKIIKYISN